MPRIARVKSFDSIYHIMMRSITEIQLFKERNDKIKYLSLIKKYQLKYQFKLYAYCLLDNHGHLLLDCNGADVSRIMHGINLSYAMYFNRKYKRHGHVFQDRFKSKIIDSDEYLSMVSSYIHGNPKDIVNNKKQLLGYEFSSLKEYIKNTNTYEILDKKFLKDVINLHDLNGINSHLEKVFKSNENTYLDGEFENEGYEYRGHRRIITRQNKPLEILKFISEYIDGDLNNVYVKYKHKYTNIRALSCFLIHCFCNVTQKDICKIIGNISQSRVSELSKLGAQLIFDRNKYPDMINALLV